MRVTKAQRPRQHQHLRRTPAEANVKLDLVAFWSGDVFGQETDHSLTLAVAATGSFHSRRKSVAKARGDLLIH
jgi:hypothetical protein